MDNNIARKYVTKDGKHRMTIYTELFPDSPRCMCDEPVHFEDWSRDYSIMTDKERKFRSVTMKDCIIKLLCKYGERDAIIDMLIFNGKHMTDGKAVCPNALVYNKSAHTWMLKEYVKYPGQKEFSWQDVLLSEYRKCDINLYILLDECLESTIDELQFSKYWTDEVKICYYDFGHDGEVSFYDDISCEHTGIAWLEKDEFLKYSGCNAKYWKGKSLKEISGLLEELSAYARGDVFFFKTEKKVEYKVHRECISEEREPQDVIETEWEELETLSGFYGKLKEVLPQMLDNIREFKQEDLIED